jgi:peroxiredoxin
MRWIACSFLLLLSSSSPAFPPVEEEKAPASLEIGSPAPDFDLPGVDGKRYALRDFAAAKVLVVLFTSNHCPTAQAYEERVKKLIADYRDRGVALVAISPNDPGAVRLDELGYTDLSDSFEEMKLRAKHARFEFPYLYDGERQEAAKAYGPRATPHVFIFDAERKLRYTGRIDDDESGKKITSHDARNALDGILGGKPVPVEKTRSFGCSIKWSDKREDNRRFLKKLSEEKVMLGRITAEEAKALREKTDKLRLINVWATWCGPCAAEFPDLVTTHRMYRHRGFELVTISVDRSEKEADVLEFLKKREASNPSYLYGAEKLDALAEALEKGWSGALPLTLLVKPGGKVVYRHEGQIDPLELRRAIVDVLGRTY